MKGPTDKSSEKPDPGKLGDMWPKPSPRDIFFQPSLMGERLNSAFVVRQEALLKPQIDASPRVADSNSFEIFKPALAKVDDNLTSSRPTSSRFFQVRSAKASI